MVDDIYEKWPDLPERNKFERCLAAEVEETKGKILHGRWLPVLAWGIEEPSVALHSQEYDGTKLRIVETDSDLFQREKFLRKYCVLLMCY